MSHKALVRITITNPQRDILSKAVREIARELGVAVEENAVVRGWSFSEKVDFLIKLPTSYGNGFGVRVASDGIRVVADVSVDSERDLLEKIRAGINKWYTALATVESLREMGYINVRIERSGEEILVTAEEGVAW